jgi:hypothetical protein
VSDGQVVLVGAVDSDGDIVALGDAQQHDDGVVPNYGDHRHAAVEHHPFPFSSWMRRHLTHRDNAGGR